MKPLKPDDCPPFLGEPAAPAGAAVSILPIPFERTTSYGKGTELGPQAILAASEYVELWDEELQSEPYRVGVHTARAWRPRPQTPLPEAIAELEEHAAEIYAGRQGLVIGLGGEHSITAPLFRAARRAAGSIGIVQFDAHSDLRESYEGTPLSHASVMKRVLDEESVSSLAIGIRSLSEPEARLIADRDLQVIWGHELAEYEVPQDEADAKFVERLAHLPESVYLTFDVDYFDPAIVPSTGTPEPGGGSWYPTLRMLRALFREKRVVGMDIVELAPRPEQPASDFLVAKLLYKCIGYWAASRLG